MATSERDRLDSQLSTYIVETDRSAIWNSVDRILAGHPLNSRQCTLALGYVQSGKTTSMAALSATAADSRYKVIISFLGSTLLLLGQNRSRLEELLGIDKANYRWVSMPNIRGASSAREMSEWLEKGRVLFVSVLKHAGQINKVTNALEKLGANFPVLIIDDEADQASLNTRPEKPTPSSTYSAICSLRNVVSDHLYVQYTATPFAPLLLPPGDALMPTKVEFLIPGTGYTGGREFLITHANTVVRTIPHGDESTKTPISDLPNSLLIALAAFVSGAAVLSVVDPESAPVSMLIHPTHRTDAQGRYSFLLKRYLKRLGASDLRVDPFGVLLIGEYEKIFRAGGGQISQDELFTGAKKVLQQSVLWLINSASDVNKVNWNYSPFHILVGGNKLDRGFTVEGLTISYMNRKSSEQLDTTEQRARAFGYRHQYLPYCQIYASARTLRLLRGIVHTEDDLRANLRDWLDSGGTVDKWAQEIGLDLPTGSLPTRKNVIPALSNFNPDGMWHVLRRPLLDSESLLKNASIIQGLGLLNAPPESFGRIAHRMLRIPIFQVIHDVLGPWSLSDESPSWRHDMVLEFLERHPTPHREVPVLLLVREVGSSVAPRERKWADDTGFINLFQGRDLDSTKGVRYEGDRTAGLDLVSSDGIVLQVHYVKRTGVSEPGFYTLAIHLGDRQISRRKDQDE